MKLLTAFPRRTFLLRGAALDKLLFTTVGCFLCYQLFGEDVVNQFTGFVDHKKHAFKAEKVVEICASAKASGCDFVDRRGDVTKTLQNLSEGKQADSSRRSAEYFQYSLTEDEIAYLDGYLEVIDGQLVQKQM